MITPNLFEKFKRHMFGKYSKGLGQMLLVTGTAGWVLSALGQLAGIYTNDKLSKDQKKFLIPQEFFDALFNIASFYFVTKGIKNLSKYLVSSGKIITKEIGIQCEKNKILFNKMQIPADSKVEVELTKDIGKAFSDKIADLKSTLKIMENEKVFVNPFKKASLSKKLEKLQTFYDDTYAPFESGVETMGSVVGAVISSNIITPMIRNPLAAKKQKQAIEREKMHEYMKQQQIAEKPVVAEVKTPKDAPATVTQNRVSMADYMTRSNSSMRV